jgi:uncharacterized membrane protein YkoI
MPRKENHEMTNVRWLLAAVLGLALVTAGVGVGIASSASDDERIDAESEGTDTDEPTTGSDAERAAAAALEYTDGAYATGGEVTEVEAGDDGAAFGVEVRLPDGRQVEVHVDADFTIAGEELDDE